MDQVHLAAAAEIAADRSGRRLQAVGRAQHVADDFDRVQPLDRHRDDRRRRDEPFERRIKRLVDVFGVMLLGQLRCDLQHPHRDDVQSFAFEPRDDLAHQTALNAIGFEEHEGALNVGHRRFGDSGGGGAGESFPMIRVDPDIGTGASRAGRSGRSCRWVCAASAAGRFGALPRQPVDPNPLSSRPRPDRNRRS